jgi:hypothetical protein
MDLGFSDYTIGSIGQKVMAYNKRISQEHPNTTMVEYNQRINRTTK